MRIVPRDWPIAWRITAGLLVAGIVPLIVVTLLTAKRGSEAVREESYRMLRLLSRVTAARVDQFIDDYAVTVAALRRAPILLRYCEGDSSVREDLQEISQVVAEVDPAVSSLFFTDPAGNVFLATAKKTKGKNVAFRKYWKEARAGRSYISTLIVGRHTKKPGIYISGPIRRGDGPILGVAVLKIDATVLQKYVEDVSLGQAGGAVLLDANGVVLAAPDPEYRFHSLAPLTPEQIREINPKALWDRETILPAPLAAAEVIDHEVDGDTWRAELDDEVYYAGEAKLEVVPWRVMTYEPRSAIDEPVRDLMAEMLGAIALVALFTVLFVFSHSRSILQPVRRLSKTAEKLTGGDLDARAEVTSDDEIGRLARAFNEMVPELQAGMAMRHSLGLAQDVQKNLLPEAAPEFPGVELAGHSVPADETGGDYYDFMDLRPWGDNRLAVVVGDVVGHGVAAALLMATARANLRSRARPLGDLEPLFAGMNQLLAEDVQHGQFMTMLFLVFDPEKKSARWVNAGHHPPFHLQVHDGAVSERTSENIPLGVVSDWTFEASDEVQLHSGDLLLLGTDGIWEAVNPRDEQYGRRRIAQVMQKNRDKSSAEIIEALLADLAIFREGVPFNDDVTMVVMRMA